jgi:hypothetical protein
LSSSLSHTASSPPHPSHLIPSLLFLLLVACPMLCSPRCTFSSHFLVLSRFPWLSPCARPYMWLLSGFCFFLYANRNSFFFEPFSFPSDPPPFFLWVLPLCLHQGCLSPSSLSLSSRRLSRRFVLLVLCLSSLLCEPVYTFV